MRVQDQPKEAFILLLRLLFAAHRQNIRASERNGISFSHSSLLHAHFSPFAWWLFAFAIAKPLLFAAICRVLWLMHELLLFFSSRAPGQAHLFLHRRRPEWELTNMECIHSSKLKWQKHSNDSAQCTLHTMNSVHTHTRYLLETKMQSTFLEFEGRNNRKIK